MCSLAQAFAFNEQVLRKELVKRALNALSTEVSGPMQFE
jgi:hypothetical protein